MADRTISGLGDISVSLMWSPFTKSTSTLKGLSFKGGFILPTGAPADQPLVGVANPSVFQLGAGAYQLTLGTNYTWGNGDWNYRLDLNTTLPLNQSSENFKPAAMYYGGLSAGRSINDAMSFRLGLNVTHLEDDQFNGAALVTGYTAVAAKLGLVWKFNDDYALSSSVSVPIYRDVNQTQLAAGTLFQLGISRSF